MTPRDILVNGAFELSKPPSENAIPARLAEIGAALEQYGSSAAPVREALNFYWNDLSDGETRNLLIFELRRLATR